MSTTLYRTASATVTSHRFRKAACKVGIGPSQSMEITGYRLATVESSWLVHRALKNGGQGSKGWSVSHVSTGKSIGHTFETLDNAKSFALSLAASTGADSTPALDATPFGFTALKPEALTELRRIKAVFDGWLSMMREGKSPRSGSPAEHALPHDGPEPQPSDGPDHHAEHGYRKAHQPASKTALPHPNHPKYHEEGATV